MEVLTEAIAQVPGTHRKKLLIRSDGAGSSHGLLDWPTEQGTVRGRSVEYSVGFAITGKLRDAIDLVPKKVWTPALDADGGVREGGDVAELTGLIDPKVLAEWPAGMRVIVRRERPNPGPT
ncbi:transposase [Kocuria rhizophila]|nr:transposase [Kocuria rhizophila]